MIKLCRAGFIGRVSDADVKRSLIGVALGGIVLLITLAIYGAFLGAQHAGAFFNTPPLIKCIIMHHEGR